MIRLNITMPEDLAEQLGHVPNKSRFIAQALREKLERERKEKLERLLIEGYKDASIEDKKVTDDWDEGVMGDGWK